MIVIDINKLIPREKSTGTVARDLAKQISSDYKLDENFDKLIIKFKHEYIISPALFIHLLKDRSINYPSFKGFIENTIIETDSIITKKEFDQAIKQLVANRRLKDKELGVRNAK